MEPWGQPGAGSMGAVVVLRAVEPQRVFPSTSKPLHMRWLDPCLSQNLLLSLTSMNHNP